MKQVINLFKIKLKENKKKYKKLCGRYEKVLKGIQMKYNKFAQDLRKKILKTYNIQVLQQQN